MIPQAAHLSPLNTATAANLLAVIVMLGIPLLFHPRYQPLWQQVSHHLLPEPLPRMLLLLAILLAHGVAQLGGARLLAVPVRRVLAASALFVVAGYVAYAIVYLLSPGYVFTGYRFRFAPLTVFFTDVLIAAGVYLFFPLDGGIGRTARLALAGALGRCRGRGRDALLGQCPVRLRRAYAPDQFGILQKLRQPPFVGASFVSNTYAAPVAAFTGKWAYIDQDLAQAKVVERGGARRLKTDDRYIWLADRDSNPAYRQPQYFICLVPQSMLSALEKVRRDNGVGPGYPGCASMGLVRHALSGPKDVIPRAELVAMDTEGPKKYGHETWAILKLDWGP